MDESWIKKKITFNSNEVYLVIVQFAVGSLSVRSHTVKTELPRASLSRIDETLDVFAKSPDP